MCGRFALSADPRTIAEKFALADLLPLAPRYNIAPSQNVPAILGNGEGALFQWGLVPSWSKQKKVGFSNINARVETASTSPAFRSAFKRRRCLMPADGFYEWEAVGDKKSKQPWRFSLKDESVFAFAAIWETWEKDGESLQSCALITTEANAVVQPVHRRMPAILKEKDYQRWLNPQTAIPDLLGMLIPYPPELMIANPVGTLVNSPRFDGPECIEPPRELIR